MFDWTLGRVQNYSNMNHPCPYEGHVYLKIDNISVHHFPVEPLIPAGRYRVDAEASFGKGKKVYATASVFLSVSDVRVERFW